MNNIKVFSAYSLSQSTKKAVEDVLISGKDKQKSDIAWIIEPALIGGIKVIINHQVIDLSLKHKISQLIQVLKG